MEHADTAPEPTLMESSVWPQGKSGRAWVHHRPPVHEIRPDWGLVRQQSRLPEKNRNASSAVVSHPLADAGYSFPGGICPRCNSIATRIPRRLLDLIVSIFIPVRRYQCHSMGCGWEGTIRLKRFQKLIGGQR